MRQLTVWPGVQTMAMSEAEAAALREALRALSPDDPGWRAAYDRLAAAGELMGDGSWRVQAATAHRFPADGPGYGIRP